MHKGTPNEVLQQKIKKPESKIIESNRLEDELKRIFNLSLDMIGSGNLDGYFTKINSSFESILGYTAEEFLKKPFLSFVHDDDFEKTNEALSQAAEADQEIFIENRYKCKSGSYKWIEWKVLSIVRDNKFIAVGRDITDRKQALETIERERDLLQAVMDGAKDSHLVFLDRDFNFVRVNATYAKTCGYEPEEMIGKNHFDLYPHPENEAIFARVRDTGECFQIRDKPFIYPDQPERGVTYWDWTLTPVKNNAGYVTGLVFSLFETTKRKRANEALLQERDHLQKALAEIKTLQGILPICSVCKKIRDDKGYWSQIESYINNHSDAEFSHSICPDCAKNIYPDFQQPKE